MTVIDAHHHFWKTALQDQPWRSRAHKALERDYEPADLIPELDLAGVDATVVMQSVDEPAENDRLRLYAEQPRVAGVVAWLPIRDKRLAQQELNRIQISNLCGVRCLIADDPLDWLADPGSIELFREIAARGLAWDVVPITSHQARQVTALATSVPELRIIIDHLGRPPLDSNGWEPWASHVKELAGCPNVAMKLSVGIDALTAWNSWDAEILDPYFSYVCEHFGSDRLMLASNWPVVLLKTTYAQAWSDLSNLAHKYFLLPQEHINVSGGSAQRWYQLSGSDRSSKEVSPAAN
jgi:L-fuconolactonase